MSPFVDGHSHVTPHEFPRVPGPGAAARWPCMRCEADGRRTVMLGEAPFRTLDRRSWDVEQRLQDMDRDGVTLQILSPMPELLSYWMTPDEATVICDTSNAQIADMIARAPRRFRGLGAVPLQEPSAAARDLRRIRSSFGLSGVEIGSNVNGVMLGDPSFDPFWAAAEAEGLAVFVHALHPVAAKPIAASPIFTAFALFPVDVAMAAASLIMAGILDRHPGLRIGFSHGGGALAAVLGRLDTGWAKTGGFQGQTARSPSDQARSFFYDSNVYDPAYLNHLAVNIAPGRVFAGTDYPYEIMQTDPVGYIRAVGLPDAAADSMSVDAASAFVGEDLRELAL